MKQQNYTSLSLDELRTEEKKTKRLETLGTLVIGFLFGVMIYGTVKNGLAFLHIFLPLLLILGLVKNAQNLRKKRQAIRAEMDARGNSY